MTNTRGEMCAWVTNNYKPAGKHLVNYSKWVESLGAKSPPPIFSGSSWEGDTTWNKQQRQSLRKHTEQPGTLRAG